MGIISLEKINKQFVNVQALNEVSLDIPAGCIFGLLGPNGAGKTTLIRIITGILGADSGKLHFRSEAFQLDHVKQMGYMPEERGLYKKMKVGEQLLYLTSLKGVDSKSAKAAIKDWLSRFEIEDWWDRKIEDLSKGMQQKVQFIATVAHDPQLLILDEPFSGLDPINTELIKGELHRMVAEGKSVIFSTHRMEQVEEVCEHIALINDGRLVLEGNVTEVRDRFKENCFEIRFDAGKSTAPLRTAHLSFEIIKQDQHSFIARLNEGFTGNNLLQEVVKMNLQVTSFQEILPTINEIFIRQVNQQTEPQTQQKIRA